MANKCEEPGKRSWPELVGTKGDYAKQVVEKENPNVTAEIILDGTGVPEIFSCVRVFVWVDDCGTVVQVPVIG